MKNLLFVLFSLFILFRGVAAQNGDFPVYSVRAAGLGNAVISCVNISGIHYYNPAALAFREKNSFSFIFNGIGYFSQDSFDFFRFIDNNQSVLQKNFTGPVDNSDYVNKLNQFASKWQTRGLGNFSFEYIKNGFALSVISFYRQAYKLNGDQQIAEMTFWDNMSFITHISYSKKIPNYSPNSPLSVGFSFEWNLAKVNENMAINNDQLFNLYYSSFSPGNIFNKYPDVFNKGDWQNSYFFNVGFLYELNKYHLNIASVLNNVLSGRENGNQKLYGKFGVSYRWPRLQNRKIIRKFIIAWNAVNLGGESYDFLKNNFLGMEIRFPVVDLRAGFHRRELSYGFGINLGPLHLNLAAGFYKILETHSSKVYLFELKLGNY